MLGDDALAVCKGDRLAGNRGGLGRCRQLLGSIRARRPSGAWAKLWMWYVPAPDATPLTPREQPDPTLDQHPRADEHHSDRDHPVGLHVRLRNDKLLTEPARGGGGTRPSQ